MSAASQPGALTVGLDVGGTKVLGVLLGHDGEVLGTVRLPSRHGAEGVAACAAEAVTTLCADAGVRLADLTGVGVGVPGLVDPVTGTVSHAVNLDLVGEVPLGAMLGARLGDVPVDVENDLNIAALGAARVLGVAGGDLAYLALGTGVAAGLLLGGRLRRGYAGAAGEIGHVPYVLDGPPCPCGQRGCLELYASGSAIRTAWGAPTPGPAPATVFARAAEGDVQAVQVRDGFADAVAAAVRLLVLTVDVEHVVLGGGVAELGDALLDAVRAAVHRQEEGSSFLRSLRIADRLQVVPRGALVAPVGAALAVRERLTDRTEAVPWRS